MWSAAPGMRVSLTAMVPSFVLVEAGEQLPDAERLSAGDDPSGRGVRPAPLAAAATAPRATDWPMRWAIGGETRRRARAARLAHARRAEEHHAAGGLLGEALEKAVDDQSAEAVADEVHHAASATRARRLSRRAATRSSLEEGAE